MCANASNTNPLHVLRSSYAPERESFDGHSSSQNETARSDGSQAWAQARERSMTPAERRKFSTGSRRAKEEEPNR